MMNKMSWGRIVRYLPFSWGLAAVCLGVTVANATKPTIFQTCHKVLTMEEYGKLSQPRIADAHPYIRELTSQSKVQAVLPMDPHVVERVVTGLVRRISQAQGLNSDVVGLLIQRASVLSLEFFESSKRQAYVFVGLATGPGVQPGVQKDIILFKTSGGEVAVSVLPTDGSPYDPRETPWLFLTRGSSIGAKSVFLGEAAVSSLEVGSAFPILRNALEKTRYLAAGEIQRFDAWSADAQKEIQLFGVREFFLNKIANGNGLNPALRSSVVLAMDAAASNGPATIAELKGLIKSAPRPSALEIFFKSKKRMLNAVDAALKEMKEDEFGEKFGREYQKSFSVATQAGGKMLVTLSTRVRYRFDAEGNVRSSMRQVPTVTIATSTEDPRQMVNQQQIDQLTENVLLSAREAALQARPLAE